MNVSSSSFFFFPNGAIGKRSDPDDLLFVACQHFLFVVCRLHFKDYRLFFFFSPLIFLLHQMASANNFHIFLHIFVLFCFISICYAHIHTRERLRSWGGVCPTDRHGWEREREKEKDGTECPRRGGGREREVLNGTPKPLRGSVGKVTWPELGPFYIRRQPNLSCVCVCVSVCTELCIISSGSDLLFHRITIRGERGDVSNERIKLIDQTDFYVYRSVMRL
jgi:hypothetical protein